MTLSESGLLFPEAPHAPDRDTLLRDLGLTGPDPDLDAFAQQMAHEAGVPYGMVNIFRTQQQCFDGLCTPGEDSELPTVGRSMALTAGFCPEVVETGLARVHPDLYASRDLASNEVVDILDARTYAGAPLIHVGHVLGTVCFLGPEPRGQETGRPTLHMIKSKRDELLVMLLRRSGFNVRQ
ncbi:GAF domain-containing protein [Streptomyces sp. NPDC058284]|uniref:GAF domain-containing protein n=1 Tax=unclassified Streptomyces TaxID=2593676 RepID=UPI003647FA6C